MNIIRMDVVGKCIVHVWYDREKNVDFIWNGRVMHVEKDLVSNDPLLVINYWDKDKAKEERDDTSISIFQFDADYYCEDLIKLRMIL